MNRPEIDPDLIDEAVLALMHLTLHDDGSPTPIWRAWKSFDWSALARLHHKGLILDPVGKARSLILTEEGQRLSEEAFYRLFSSREPHLETGDDGGQEKAP
ncbi:DUF6429 family protein [Novosphingobium rosa]|uniref:DUF6429 family protein n=1 Tax=Novosphingobium rosa TaxID=76978 RepID=UPI000835E679|nr:DUF6429 family protein [Novosphingobium rosa]